MNLRFEEGSRIHDPFRSSGPFFIDEHIAKLKMAIRETIRARAIQRDTLGKRFLASIRGKDIADFIKKREKNGAGPKTIKLNLSLLSKLFNLCKTHWGMESLQDPVSFVQKPKLPRGRDRRLIQGNLKRSSKFRILRFLGISFTSPWKRP